MMPLLRLICSHRHTETRDGETWCLDCGRVQMILVGEPSGRMIVTWISPPHTGIAWVEGRPETVRTYDGLIHREWTEFCLGIRTWWPDPRQARRTCTSEPWSALEIKLNGGAEALARRLEAMRV